MSDLVYHTEHPPEPAQAVKPEARPLPENLAEHVPALLPCKRCNGAGHTLSKGFSFTREETGKRVSYPSKWQTCHDCDGKGWFHAPDPRQLLTAVKGRKPGTLRSKRPDSAREYYLWRLARFHGGKDVCLPMGAEMEVGGDPYKELIDELAKQLAKHLFGSGNVGMARWQQAIYGSHSFADVPADTGMMPVYDSDKPMEEMLETV